MDPSKLRMREARTLNLEPGTLNRVKHFVLFVNFVVQCLFRIWLRLCCAGF